MRAAFSYLGIFVSLLGVGTILSFVMLMVSMALRGRLGTFGSAWRFACECAEMAGAICIVCWLATIVGARASCAAFLLPAFATFLNALKRVEAAKTGASGARALFEARGELDRYDQAAEIATEKAGATGIVAGYILGIWIMLPGAPLV